MPRRSTASRSMWVRPVVGVAMVSSDRREREQGRVDMMPQADPENIARSPIARSSCRPVEIARRTTSCRATSGGKSL